MTAAIFIFATKLIYDFDFPTNLKFRDFAPWGYLI